MIQFKVYNRFSGDVQFTAQIDCAEDAPMQIKLRLAIEWALKARYDLRGADLRYAVLMDADLRGAVLTGADLRGAVLRDADLRAYKADLWITLTQNPDEVPALIEALKAGRINGSQYSGECACLVGTIANAKGVSHKKLEHDARNPAEQWFLMIREGDKPGDDTGGGFAAGKALEWAEEWLALNRRAA